MTPSDLVTAGQRIRWLRERRQLSQHALAKAINVRQPALSQIERGVSKNPASTTLLRIAAVLEANPEWIINGRGDPFLTVVASSAEMAAVFADLSPAHQAAILAAAKSLL